MSTLLVASLSALLMAGGCGHNSHCVADDGHAAALILGGGGGLSDADTTGTAPIDPESGAQSCGTAVGELGDNEGAWLPGFSITGEGLDNWQSFPETGPGVRDYSRKWVYSSSRKRAYYAGANHCSPHRFNDLWAYDLRTNTWSLLYAPDFNDCIYDWEKRKAAWDEHCIVKNEVLQTTRGGMCEPGHTWWGITYDETLDRVLWMSEWTGGEKRYLEEKGMLDAAVNDDLPPLWSFDPETREWSLVRTPLPVPRGSKGGALNYIPNREMTIWYGAQWNGSGMWALDSHDLSWRQRLTVRETYHDPEGESPIAEYLVNFDRKHDVLVGFGKDGRIHVYDFEDNDWTVRHEGVTSDIAPNKTALAYDSRNGVHLLANSDGLFVYDYATNEAKRIDPVGGMPNLITTRQHMIYYDTQCNVFVFYFGKSTDRHWVYRYRQ